MNGTKLVSATIAKKIKVTYVVVPGVFEHGLSRFNKQLHPLIWYST